MKLKKCVLFARKAVTKLDNVLKSRDITLLTKVHLVKAVVFPVVTYICESWTIKKAEHRIIDAFELWCWRRLSRVSWTAKRSNQSILKEINPEYSLERLMLKLKFQYFGHLMRSDQISHSVVSNSLRPHESQHARPPCPSPTPGVHPDSRPSSQ